MSTHCQVSKVDLLAQLSLQLLAASSRQVLSHCRQLQPRPAEINHMRCTKHVTKGRPTHSSTAAANLDAGTNSSKS